jgi:hypothetical protein
MPPCPHCGGPLDPSELAEDCGYTPMDVCRRCHSTQERQPTLPGDAAEAGYLSHRLAVSSVPS